MQQVGVEAVVEGLQSFLGDMGQVNSALNGLRPAGTLLEQMFSSVSSAIGGFGREVLNVVETTLGVMLRDAIEFLIGKLGELVSAIIDTGNEFQTLKIRLTGLNLNETADGVKTFTQAMSEAQEMTAKELEWLQNLGAATPFDPAQIADTYTQARAFGFAADEAKRLTKDIIEYTAGMGLSNETLFLVIQNMGQMVQRGKITGTEIRDLARGSFLPLADVLERIAKNMGMTVKELTKKISSPEGIPAQEFVKAFEQMVEEEPRFIGAAGRLSRALVPAAMNVKELFTSILGLNVATPVFDVLGERVASFTDQFVYFNEQGDLIKTDKWDALVKAATELGLALKTVVFDLLGLLPTSAALGDSLISGLQGVADWVNTHRGDIVGFFRGIADTIATQVVPFIRDQLIPAIGGFVQWVIQNSPVIMAFFAGIGDVIQNYIIPFIRDNLVPAFELISSWVTVNKPLIDEFFTTLGAIITDVINQLIGKPLDADQSFLMTLLNVLKDFMQFVIDNKDKIADWLALLIRIGIAVQVVITVFNIVIGVILAVGGVLLSVAAVISFVIGVVAFFASGIGFAILAIVGFAAVISTFVKNTQRNFDQLRNFDWAGIGTAIIQGIGNAVSSAANWLADVVRDAVKNAYEAALAALGISSPSKLFMQIGAYTMEGFAQGVEQYASVAAGAMTSAMTRVATPAISMPGIIQSVVAQGAGGSVQNTSNRNYNLTVNSGANTEPILQDFNMMQSLAG